MSAAVGQQEQGSERGPVLGSAAATAGVLCAGVGPGKQKIMEGLQRVQRRTGELGKGVQHKAREEVLREL